MSKQKKLVYTSFFCFYNSRRTDCSDYDPVSSGLLCGVELLVGGLDIILSRKRKIYLCAAETHGHLYFRSLEHAHRIHHSLSCIFSNCRCVLQRTVRQHYYKFLAVYAVRRLTDASQDRRNMSQRLVSGVVTVCIVYLFKKSMSQRNSDFFSPLFSAFALKLS